MTDVAERLLRAAAAQAAAEPDPTADAIADAALKQFELFGLARTTMDDVARRAKVARVTLYRHFPGREALIEAVILRELQRFLADLEAALAGYDALDDRLVEGFVFVLDAIRGHRLLQRMLEGEPESILPHLTADRAPIHEAARAYLAAQLLKDLGGDRSSEEVVVAADIVIRLIISFMLNPSGPVDLRDPEHARAYALRYLRPILIGASGR